MTDMDNPLDASIGEAPEQDNPQGEIVAPETKERYKTILSGKEKQAKEAERLRLLEKTARHVLANPEKLLDLPPETGREVVQILHSEGNATTDDYDSIISSLNKPLKSDTKISADFDEDALLRRFEEKQEQKQSQNLVNSWISKYAEEKQEELLEEFKEIAGDRKLDPIKTQRIIDRIDAYYRKQELEDERRDMTYAAFASS